MRLRYLFGLWLIFFLCVLIYIAFFNAPFEKDLLLSPISPNGHRNLPKIYIITATFNRWVQKAELTRLCSVFKHVPNILWILVEDAKTKSKQVGNFLTDCHIPYVHLNAETPDDQRLRPGEPYWARPKGIEQRNMGLHWLRNNLIFGQDRGVVYMADDDNTYSVEVFQEMRTTQRVSTWPVAFAGELPWEGCITTPTNPTHIERMWSAILPNRTFPIDMAGFAVNLDLVLTHPNAKFDYYRPRGMQESEFLTGLGLKDWRELEPKADGCRKILVWHTRTANPVLATWHSLRARGVEAPSLDAWF